MRVSWPFSFPRKPYFALTCSYDGEMVEPGGAHDRQGDLSYAKSFID